MRGDRGYFQGELSRLLRHADIEDVLMALAALGEVRVRPLKPKPDGTERRKLSAVFEIPNSAEPIERRPRPRRPKRSKADGRWGL